PLAQRQMSAPARAFALDQKLPPDIAQFPLETLRVDSNVSSVEMRSGVLRRKMHSHWVIAIQPKDGISLFIATNNYKLMEQIRALAQPIFLTPELRRLLESRRPE